MKKLLLTLLLGFLLSGPALADKCTMAVDAVAFKDKAELVKITKAFRIDKSSIAKMSNHLKYLRKEGLFLMPKKGIRIVLIKYDETTINDEIYRMAHIRIKGHDWWVSATSIICEQEQET